MPRRRVARQIELARTMLIALGLLVGALASRGAATWQAPPASVAQRLALESGADSSGPRPNTGTYLLGSAPGDPVACFGKRTRPGSPPSDGVGPDPLSAHGYSIALGARVVAGSRACLIDSRSSDVSPRGTRTTRGPPTTMGSMLPITI